VSTEQANLSAFAPDLSELSEAERDVYRRVELEGDSRQVVADETDRSVSTVDTLLHRARRKRGEMPRV